MLIVGTPYIIGGLVLLEPAGLMQSLGGILTAGLASTQPGAMEFLGRVFVVFCFNEAVALGLGLATTGKRLGSFGISHAGRRRCRGRRSRHRRSRVGTDRGRVAQACSAWPPPC